MDGWMDGQVEVVERIGRKDRNKNLPRNAGAEEDRVLGPQPQTQWHLQLSWTPHLILLNLTVTLVVLSPPSHEKERREAIGATQSPSW
jgi:hypothetical protein